MSISQAWKIIAAIDLGANYLKMTIGEINKQGEIIILDEVVKPTKIGKDTFSKARISVKTIHETCDDLNGFVRLMNDYKIKFYKAVATSGMREAENKQYVLEQIRLRTGLNVESINVAEEQFYMLKAVRNHVNSIDIKKSEQYLIVNITSGAVETSIYEDGRLKFTEHVKIGSLKIRESLSDLEAKTIEFSETMQQYIESKIYTLKPQIKKFEINHFLGLGGELNTICGIIRKKSGANKKDYYIKKEALLSLTKEISNMDNFQIKTTFGLSNKTAELLLPSILIFYCFLKMTKAEVIQIPKLSLRQGILYDLSDEILNIPRKEELIHDIISSVWYIGEKYQIDKEHATFVEKLSLEIFDHTKSLHKLGERERLYLQVAAILHDVGGFISANNHNFHSYNIIRAQSIVGFSDIAIEIIASAARYHSEEIPIKAHNNYRALSDVDKMIVSTLAAILKLSEALDISHMQKIKEIKLLETRDNIFFNLKSKGDIILEEWNFSKYVDFFEEVIGVKPII
ncbi:HD domain-containing protein [Clostridium estertheticum]|uniref:Ppx/GppA phosphatase family protein n=1 Tax=Clostridium estertheticum TaxID=238834 RepID=UPI001C0B4F4E|nr:HD domain-containing protein [Clostridium estertheticum]MBU3216343.1 HD domain-containing protein [Clostridium estertheticum]WAG55424.1 HD domain-containing protein [Clostridium estertheticum]